MSKSITILDKDYSYSFRIIPQFEGQLETSIIAQQLAELIKICSTSCGVNGDRDKSKM